jgi:deazaflavin-dependent oxidoreductase (nitroreductase family)
MPTPPPMPPPGSLRAKVANTFINANVFLYRRSGGRLGGKFKGAPVLLLDHVGRKSGRARTSPVLYLEEGPNLVVVGSRGGSEAMPAWWLNLKANPETSVQIGTQRRTVVARQATAEEKGRLWPRLVEMYDDYAVYQRRTDRDIPVIILSPAPTVRSAPDSVA